MADNHKAIFAENLLRTNQSKLTDLIVSAGLGNFSDECETRRLITPNTKEEVISSSIGKTESGRASLLVDKIRKSILSSIEPDDTHKTMDDFLCVLFKTGDHNGQSLAKQLAEKYDLKMLRKFKGLLAASSSTNEETDSAPEIPDRELDQIKLFKKVPTIQDILTVVPEDCYNDELRAELNLPPSKKTLEEGMKAWIDEETSEVTWLNLIQAVKKSGNGAAAKHIARTFLRRPSVYKRYISTSDYESFDDMIMMIDKPNWDTSAPTISLPKNEVQTDSGAENPGLQNGFALTKFDEVVECHERTLLAQSPMASTTATEDQTDSGPETPDSRLTDYMSKIQQCIATDQELQQGIIFVITMYGIQGSNIDRDRVAKTFKQLSFAVFLETSLTASDLGWLMQAASQVKYPYTYKYIAFYFSGHGMIDEHRIEFIGTQNSNNATTKMNINEYIMNPLLRVKKVHKLFLLDCCRLVNDKSLSIFSDDKMDTSVSEYGNSLYVEAHSVSYGKETTSTQVGSEWTRELCRTLDKQQKPFVHIFSEVRKKTGDTHYLTNTSEDFIIKRVNDNVYADLLKSNLAHSKKIVVRLKNEEMREKDAKELKSILDTACDNDEIVKEVIKKIKENLLSLELIDSVCRELQLQ